MNKYLLLYIAIMNKERINKKIFRIDKNLFNFP